MTTRRLLLAISGGFACSALCFIGCGKTDDSGGYHEISEQPGDDSPCNETKQPEKIYTIEAVLPAIAEKSDAPAIAQASFERTIDSQADSQSKNPTVALGNPDLQPVAVAKPGGIQLLIPEKTFQKEGPEGALRVSYDDLDLLKVLNMEPVPADVTDHFPDWLEGLDGKRILIRGFMFPPFQNTGLRGFTLARDNQICCFGRNPKIYDLIHVSMRTGTTTDYLPNRPFDVVGTFRIRPESEDGVMLGLYEIEDASVITKHSR